MKPNKDADKAFEWDMTVVMLLVVFIMLVLIVAFAFGPFGHRT